MEHFTLPHQHGQSRDQLMNNIPSTENFQILADTTADSPKISVVIPFTIS